MSTSTVPSEYGWYVIVRDVDWPDPTLEVAINTYTNATTIKEKGSTMKLRTRE